MTIRLRRTMSRAVSSDSKISMRTATGIPLRSTELFGTRELMRDGRPITKDTGHGSIPGGGRGSTMHAGDMRLFTMGAGFLLRDGGAGFRAPSKSVLCMRLRWLLSSAEVPAVVET